MNKLNQRGFSAVEAILILVVVGIIGGVSWFVYLAKNETNNALNNATKGQGDVTKSENKSTTTEQKQPVAQKYLEIKEWGVKIPLTVEIEDAYYSGPKEGKYIYLSLKSLENTECAAAKTSLGAITREDKNGLPPANQNENEQTTSNAGAVNIGEFYYFYSSPQASCSEDESILAKAGSARQAFATATKNIKSTQ